MKFDDILEKLEIDKEVLDFKFLKSQIPMYLIMRFNFMQSLINKEFHLSNPHVKVKKKSIISTLKYIYHTVKSNLFFAPKKDIYIFTSGVLNVLENGKFINRLYNEFLQIFPEKTQLFEISLDKTYSLPKKKKTYFIDFIDFIVIICSKLIYKKTSDMITINNFISHISQNINLTEEQKNEILIRLDKSAQRINLAILLYKIFLKIKKPKILIIDCAHYGVYIPLIMSAKQLGIVTVEYQHGYVGMAHPAYNYHDNILVNIKPFYPEYFLTHGKYWSDRVRVPSGKIEIGLPSLVKKLENLENIEKKEKSILFISGGTVYKELKSLINFTMNELIYLGYEVVLRPHPSELNALEERYGSLIKKGVKIDTAILYETLSRTEIIVGMEVSTVLFEAICFTPKVYLKNTKYTKFYEEESKFLIFENSVDLINSINQNNLINVNKEYFWEMNWEKNYKNFIREILRNMRKDYLSGEDND